MKPSPNESPRSFAGDGLDGALERARTRLRAFAAADGTYEGNLEVGLLFNSASLVLGRFNGDDVPAGREQIELGYAQYIVSQQAPSGLFRAYPDGPESGEATRLGLLGLRRIAASNRSLTDVQRARFQAAIDRATTALDAAPSGDLFSLRAFRILFELLDANREAGEAPLVPDLRTLGPPMATYAWFFERLATPALEGVFFPFVTCLAPMVGLLLHTILRRSGAGGAVSRALQAMPGVGRLLERNPPEALLRFLLTKQDGTGAIFYSANYSEFFIAAARGVLPQIDAPDLRAQTEAALQLAESYVERRHVETDDGLYLRFLGSDVWDSAGVATTALMASKPLLNTEELVRIAKFVLENQTSAGGWAFARQSNFTDCDSTGFILSFLVLFRTRRVWPQLDDAIDGAIARAVDLLAAWVADCGGFGAWGKSRWDKSPGATPELQSMMLDLPAEDVTGRALMGLGHVRELYKADAGFRARFTAKRHALLVELSDRALSFVRARCDPATGFWPARWTVGYLSGASFVCAGLRQQPVDASSMMNQAVATLRSVQNADGGFGESIDSDLRSEFVPSTQSTVFHTGCALAVFKAAGVSPADAAVQRALRYLLERQLPDGSWPLESVCTCFTGFYYRYDVMALCDVIAALEYGLSAAIG